jgi:23S rRNA pseudouridine955/2504/2580 synthase
MEKLEYTIDVSAAGMRADRLVRKLFPRMPLSHVYKMLRKGRAKIAGKKVKLDQRLEKGQVVTLYLMPEDAALLKARLSAVSEKPPVGKTCKVPILYEDEHVIAFDKPAGMAVHAGSGHEAGDTVLGALLAHTGKRGGIFQPGLVGRLDRDASGIQLGGLSPEGLRGLGELALQRKMKKVYIALVSDEKLKDQGRIDTPLVDEGEGGARMKPGEDGAEAVTVYRVRARAEGVALVEVMLETGRRHQIRAHFASINAPLAGDVRYGDRAWNGLLKKKVGLTRLFLHCTRVEFEHPVTGRKVRILSPLPKELTAVVEKLGIS